MKINPKTLIDYFVELYQHEKEMFGVDVYLSFMKLDNIHKIETGKEYITLYLKNDDKNTIAHRLKISTYLEYVKFYREDKLKRILG